MSVGARPVGQTGDRVLLAMCALAGLLVVVVLVEVAIQIVSGAHMAISKFGLGFVGHTAWAPNFGRFGAASMLYGTAVTSVMALVIATPLGVAIGLYLATIAPGRLRMVIGPLVEMMAAIPSIILGFWGVIVLAPFLQRHLEPFLHRALGFLPIFGSQQTTGLSLFTAGLVLSFMVLPIVASLSRDLFLTVPRDLTDGAAALGATRWEVIRGVVLPTTISGVAAATVLGLGRALGEAIAVMQVVGDGSSIHSSLFTTGSTLGARIGNDFPTTLGPLHVSALFYLALILLVIGLITSWSAQKIAVRFSAQAVLAN
jgi:phosphate transport system permease protein